MIRPPPRSPLFPSPPLSRSRNRDASAAGKPPFPRPATGPSMSSFPSKPSRLACHHAVAAAIALLAVQLSPAALAQAAPVTAASTDFHIPAQPLDQALAQLAQIGRASGREECRSRW